MLRLSETMIVSELPVEIIDMVLRGLCAADQIHAGLVCHQWHQITLPYIWRNIKVSGTRGPEHLRDPKDFLSAVIQKTPTSIASLIQRLILHEVQLDILVVVQFLESLPRLRALDLSWITLHSLDDTTQEQWKNIRRFRLDEFSVSCNSDSGSARLAEMQLLDLFSEIRQLCMDCRLYNQELAAASTPADVALDTLITARRHSVCELVVDLGSVMPPHLNLLFQRNAFRDLTCLTFSIHDLDGLQSMNTLLCMAADTLVELYLELCWDLELDNFDEDIVIFWDEPTAVTEGAARRQFVRNTLRTGLAKCTNLHAFRLQMSSTAPGEADLELPVLTELAAQGWLMAIGIIGLVHPGDTHNRLRHLSLQYWSQVFDSWTEKEVKFDQFSWDELRTVCRRFTNLRSLSVEFSRRLEDAPEVLWWQDDVLLELKEFEVFVCEDAFWVCEEPSCAIYAQIH